MTVQGRTWRRFVVWSAFPFLLAMANLAVEPDLGRATGPLLVVSYVVMVSIGCLGAVVAILARCGIVRFHYSDSDREAWDYRLAKSVAEMAQRQGRGFSRHYYESYGLLPPQQEARAATTGTPRLRREPPQEVLGAAATLLRAIGWFMLVVCGVVSSVGFLSLARPDWVVTENGIETNAIWPKLLFALAPLVPAAIAIVIIWRGSRVLRWFLSHVSDPFAPSPPGGRGGKAGGR